MTSNPNRHGERMRRMLSTWALICPDKTYCGLSLDDMRGLFQASLDARERISDLQIQMYAALAARANADAESVKAYNRAVSAIKAHSNDGDEDPLYRGLGYIPSADRRKPHRARAAASASAELTPETNAA